MYVCMYVCMYITRRTVSPDASLYSYDSIYGDSRDCFGIFDIVLELAFAPRLLRL
eukprot:SAG11_NODE_15499_length_576_cov_0.907757_1_plen_54_part_10